MGKFSELIKEDKPVLVDFFAEWCGPCKIMAPILVQVKDQLKDEVRIIKVDTDKNQELAMKFRIQGVPTLMLFRRGEMRWRQSGVLQAQDIIQVIQQYGLN
ncbi:MAG: thioredoxin [Flavobacteriales bacterium]|nr:thioredoxin [Flavobacteriales bacterium]